ncbi:MAG: 2-oxoacid ferredoxin oxidoreductase, subunit beta [Microgenomates group bacterium GW2011_GWB1_44_8]|nr:MAG: 2-oxoacid ferredoxin oxidoreductase, subunit beta [Microgenomates group bacterium GW2011_GWB1_44_8]
MTELNDLATPYFPSYCPGCGDIAIWAAIKKAAVEKGWDNTNTTLVAGIGCHGHMVNFIKITSFEGLHGRAIPVSTGIKMVNPRLNVLVITGDGDLLAEGGNHFLHVCRRNPDMAILLFDNGVYGLTTGQASPTSPQNYISKSTPLGNPEIPLHPLAVAIAAGITFAARTYSGDIAATAKMIAQAVDHRGLAIVDILQPCITFNKGFSHTYYQDNTYVLDTNYDLTNKTWAFEKSLEWGPKNIPLGIFYREERPVLETVVSTTNEPLVSVSPNKRDISELLKKYV